MSLYFTSDLHVGHQKVAELRGVSVVEHDALLARNWDRVVHRDAQVWVLGDISAGGSAAQRHALQWIAERPGIKHLIAGNHDGCSPIHRDSHRWLPEYLQVFASVQAYARRRVSGVNVLMSHYPYHGDHTNEARYMQYRLPDHGEWLMHGHTHASHRKSGRMLHVGVDAWDYRPVKLEEVTAMIEAEA